MGMLDIRFPTDISFGSQGGPSHDNAEVKVKSGARESIARLESPIMRFNAKEALKNKDEIADLIDFIRITRGSHLGFRFFDHTDHSTASDHRGAPAFDDVEIGIGDGTTTQFQLIKKYTYGGITRTRLIQLPIHNEFVHDSDYDVLIGVNGVEQASGWTVNTETGMVTFSVAPPFNHPVTGGCAFDVPAHFTKEFDDQALISLQDIENEEIPDIPIEELVNENPVEDEFYFGRSTAHGVIAADVSLSPLSGRLHEFSPLTTGHQVILPDPLNLPTGGPWFMIQNSGTEDLAIVDHLMVAVATLPAGQVTEIWLGLNSVSAKVWTAF